MALTADEFVQISSEIMARHMTMAEQAAFEKALRASGKLVAKGSPTAQPSQGMTPNGSWFVPPDQMYSSHQQVYTPPPTPTGTKVKFDTLPEPTFFDPAKSRHRVTLTAPHDGDYLFSDGVKLTLKKGDTVNFGPDGRVIGATMTWTSMVVVGGGAGGPAGAPPSITPAADPSDPPPRPCPPPISDRDNAIHNAIGKMRRNGPAPFQLGSAHYTGSQ